MTDLPPTLFRLPDLNPAANVVNPEVGGGVSEPTSSAYANPLFDTGNVGDGRHSEGKSHESYSPYQELRFGDAGDQDNRESSPAMANANEPSVSDRSEDSPSGRSPSADPVPAGRGWMETVVAHRKAVILLLVIIAAAFWTGRRRSSPTDDQVASATTSLDFDTGEMVEAGEMLEPGVAHAMASLESGETEMGTAAAIASTNPMATQAEGQTKLSSEDVPRVEVGPSEVGLNADPQAIASLGPASPSGGMANQTAALPTATDPAFDQVVIRPASSQMPNSPDIAVPSLEDLELAALAADSASMQFEPTYQETSTPQGVSDWLQFLPPQPDSATAAP